MRGSSDQINKGSRLPQRLDMQEVVDIIKNADLYDLINISLKSNEQTVEHFIQRALLQKKLMDHMQNPPP